MKKVEREYKEFKKEVERKQEIAIMLESIKILGKYLPNEEIKSDQFYYSRYYEGFLSFEIDIAHTNFYKSFYKMLPELIENDFKITLGNVSIDGLDEWFKTADIDSKKRNELKRDYYNMRTSFDILEYVNQNKRIPSVNLLVWFVENKMYEVLVNLLVSDEVPLEQKFTILDKALCEGDEEFCALLSTIPSTYMRNEWQVRKELFNELLSKNLQQVYMSQKDYFQKIVIKNIKECYSDRISEGQADKVIKSFIKFNLVDMNEITFNYKGTEITSAVAAEVRGRHDLASFLYNLPEYIKTDSKLRCQSDKVLLDLAIHKVPKYRNDLNIYNIINRKNYVNTSEKTCYILDEIDKNNSIAKISDDYTEEEIGKILEILLRKTPKEEYKKLKQELNSRKQVLVDEKMNEELLFQKRQELTTTLGKLNDYLLNNEPAKKKIKEIEFNKK